MAFVAYHFHWGPDVLLELEHEDRIRMVREIASLNQRALEGFR